MSVPSITALRMTGAGHRAELPLLVLGPSLGTSAATLWTECAAGLTDAFDVVAWDLPGHGHNHAVPEEPFTMAELAAGVLQVVEEILEQRGDYGGSFHYAGDSVGGCVGLQLLLDVPDRVASAVLLCTGARIGDATSWGDRIEQVRSSGTSAMVESSAQRWFGPGFLERSHDTGAALLQALHDADDRGYALVCEALGGFDVRHRLGEVKAPVLGIAGDADVATPPATLQEVTDGVAHGALAVLEGVAHLAPAEAPTAVALLMRRHLLGDEHEHADAADFTRDFQQLVTEYAGDLIWTRPGLDPRSRSLVTLTALVARGLHEELSLHVQTALRNGVSAEEIRELLLQTAVYCGVEEANTAFRIASGVLAGHDEQEGRRG